MTIAEILSKAGETEADALREHALLLSLSKVSRYEAECGRFRAKYGESLASLRERVGKMEEDEDFQVDDDLADWEYADTALTWWHSRVEGLRDVG